MTWLESLKNQLAQYSHILSAALFIAVALAPFYLGVFYLRIFTSILILSLFGVAFNLAFGFTNLPSFGHAAFYGLGGYGFAMTIDHFSPETILLPLLIAVVVATVFSVFIGFISLRGKGIYFALLTFAFAQFLYEIFFRLTSVTGGSDGLTVIIPETFGINLADPMNLHLLSTVLLMLVLLVSYRLLQSPFGQIMKALRYNPDRARALGYPVKQIQLAVFTISAFLSSFAGILYVFTNQFISPSVLYWQNSVDVLIVTIIGGPTSLVGPIFGAVVYTLLTEILRGYTDVGTVVLGIIFIVIILFASEGLAGLVKDIINKL